MCRGSAGCGGAGAASICHPESEFIETPSKRLFLSILHVSSYALGCRVGDNEQKVFSGRLLIAYGADGDIDKAIADKIGHTPGMRL